MPIRDLLRESRADAIVRFLDEWCGPVTETRPYPLIETVPAPLAEFHATALSAPSARMRALATSGSHPGRYTARNGDRHVAVTLSS